MWYFATSIDGDHLGRTIQVYLCISRVSDHCCRVHLLEMCMLCSYVSCRCCSIPLQGSAQSETNSSLWCKSTIFHISAYKTREVQSNLTQKLRMLLRPVHTLRPDLPTTLRAAQLPGQNHVESFHLLLGPFDARAHHWGREASLEALNRIVNDHKVNK